MQKRRSHKGNDKISRNGIMDTTFQLLWDLYIRLSEKYLSSANVSFTTVHLYRNVKPNLWNVAVFISTEQNGSYVIRQNNIKQKTLCVCYFLIKRKKLFGQPNNIIYLYLSSRAGWSADIVTKDGVLSFHHSHRSPFQFLRISMLCFLI